MTGFRVLHLHSQFCYQPTNVTVMLKTFCLTATLSTAVIVLLPFAPKIALAKGCYMQTSDGWRIDLNSLCKDSEVPVYTISKVPIHKHRNQWGLGLDLPSYCQQKYGSDAAVILEENNAMGWKCMVGTQAQKISFEEACSMQYGPFSRPAMGSFDDIGSWHCRSASNVSYQASGS